MAVSLEDFRALPVERMWELYSNAVVDRSAFDTLTKQVGDTLTALKACQDEVVKLQGQTRVNKAVTDCLRTGYIDQSKKLNKLEQYTRKENVIISGVPEDLKDLAVVESKFCETAKLIGVEISPSDISAFHPLKSKKKGQWICRFSSRRFVDRLLKNGKNLENHSQSEIWQEGNEIKIFPNLTPVNLKLRYLCRKMKERGHIAAFGFNGSGVWAQKSLYGDNIKLPIECNDDAADLLPDGMSVPEFLSSVED